MTLKNRLNKKFITVFVPAFVIGFLLYRSSIVSLISAVINRDDSSHGLFVPFLSGYFFWKKRESIRKIEFGYDFLGLILMFGGICFAFLDFGMYQTEFLGFLVFVAGLILFFLGRPFFLEISFPFFFLVTMIPLPDDTFLALANILRNITMGGAVWITSLTGITFFTEGIMVHLPNVALKVGLSCSGVRYLLSFFVFGLAYAYLYRRTFLSRLCIVTLTIPVSFAASIIRLIAIFLLTYTFGSHMADYWPHVFISWTVFFVILVMCLVSDTIFLKRHERNVDMG